MDYLIKFIYDIAIPYSNNLFQVVAFIGLLTFLSIGVTKKNKISFVAVNFVILLLWVTAWHFFSIPTNQIYNAIGELLIFFSFYFLYEFFTSLTEYRKYEEIKIFLMFSIYLILILAYSKENVVMVSTCFFIAMQIVFKILTLVKIKELRFRKRLEKFYTRFFVVAIFEDIISLLLILAIIDNIQHSWLVMYWNLIMSVIVLNGVYLMIKIKAVR